MYFLGIWLGAVTIATAQVYTPPKNSPPSKETRTTVVEEDKGRSSNSGGQLPLFDPSDEFLSWNGNSWNLSDNRLFAARFERFLNEEESDIDQTREYVETIEQILEALSPHNEGGPSLIEAYRLLPRAATFPDDANLCESLSAAIYRALQTRNHKSKLTNLLSSLRQERSDLRRKADWIATHERTPKTAVLRDKDGKALEGQDEKIGRGEKSNRYLGIQQRLAEIEALQKTFQLEGKVNTLAAKTEFQSMMAGFFVKRRFEHVIMASRFYYILWTDGKNKLEIKEGAQAEKVFSEVLGLPATVSLLDSKSSSFAADVKKGVEAFNYLMKEEELADATKRLGESYALGEFMPSIRLLTREDKRRVLDFVRISRRLVTAMNAKDYDEAESLIEKATAIARDFDPTKAKSAIAAFKQSSDLHLMLAKNYLSAKDVKRSAAEVQKSMEIWPQNPRIKEFNSMVELGGASIAARNTFDRLLSEQNYRQIFKDQYTIAPSLMGDRERQEAFRVIIENITEIEKALGKSQELSKIGQEYAAWEQLSEIRERFPDDPKLGREMEKLAPRVADFTRALEDAKQAEKKVPAQIGSALSLYLKARSYYQYSKIAKEGIERQVAEANSKL